MIDAVCDTSTLIRLTKGNVLFCTGKLFDHVYFPPSVLAECQDPETSAAIRVAPFMVHPVYRILPLGMGVGEREAISLALEIGVNTFITDDQKAFQKALSFGLSPVRTVDLLVIAKFKKLIPSVQEVLDLMRSRGEGIVPELYAMTLKRAGEGDC